MMSPICILGANSLIGQHLYTQLVGCGAKLNLWTLQDKFQDRLESNQNVVPQNVSIFSGTSEIASAIKDCDVVYNLHEYTDLSNLPDEKKLYEHNVKFVRDLMNMCKEEGTKVIIHLSSSFVQCSGKWPNVGNREKDHKDFVFDNPYPKYSKSKALAEELLKSCPGVKTLAARVGYIYGEGDENGIICDMIKVQKKLKWIPIIGDNKGAVQMAYVGNVSAALIKCKTTMEEKGEEHETVNIVDDTPINSLYDGVLKDLMGDTPSHSVPFWLAYPIFFLICWVLQILKIDFPIPSTGHFYMLCRQWTVLSNYRLRLFFDFKPRYSYNEAIKRSKTYYNNIDFDSFNSWSWRTEPR
ncbi:unnamed protein product [Bursaphelenchus xylophilus]|uniref:(pine wood nematode) hypothetical protein n=1 Tax=Bursaphelenchus xylophilus TaxID=6326 RepID=A0A1I7SU75_BURXY|nr:unnamed protein product [Bursaphelenchus xylophilus]CAG9107480.1 unnamed protein product [Bursaphelenchus xylophilus]